MSRRKQGRPQHRRQLEELEASDADRLTCGHCQAEFPLVLISSFIEHKVERCQKKVIEDDDNVDGTENNKPASLLADDDLKKRKRRNVSTPLASLCPPQASPTSVLNALARFVEDQKIKDEEEDDKVDAEIMTELSEPNSLTCCRCGEVLLSSWLLVQHIQDEHDMQLFDDEIDEDAESCLKEDSEKELEEANKEFELGKKSPSSPGTEIKLPPETNTKTGSGRLPIPPTASVPQPGFFFRMPHLAERPSTGPTHAAFPQPHFHELLEMQRMRMAHLASIAHPASPFDQHNAAALSSFAAAHHHLRPNSTEVDFYSQRLRQLAGGNAGLSPSARKQTPPFSAASPFNVSSPPSGTVPSSSSSSPRPSPGTPTSPTKRPPDLTCSVCGKRFKFATQLNLHSRQEHTHERPHKCYLCTRAFYSAVSLKSHLAVHFQISDDLHSDSEEDELDVFEGIDEKSAAEMEEEAETHVRQMRIRYESVGDRTLAKLPPYSDSVRKALEEGKRKKKKVPTATLR